MHYRKKSFGLLPLILILALSVSLAAVSGVFAKYVNNHSSEEVFHSNAFYFQSDLLQEKNTVYTLAPGTTSISFTLENGPDGLRYSADDVSYTVTATDGTLSKGSGTLATGASRTETVTLSGLTDGGEYTVIATGAAGYSKTLRATFRVLTAAEGAYYQLAEAAGEPYVLLTVWTENSTGAVFVEIPDGLVADSTWPGLSAVGAGDASFTGETLAAYSSVTYRFFKTPSYVAPAGVTVTVGGTAATAGVPK